MNKPTKKEKKFYVYRECRDYLEKKYKYKERDYAGKYKNNHLSPNKPYLDFWHWVLDHQEIHNGCFITFDQQQFDEIEQDWVKEIYARYLEEFAENGELEMYVSW